MISQHDVLQLQDRRPSIQMTRRGEVGRRSKRVSEMGFEIVVFDRNMVMEMNR